MFTQNKYLKMLIAILLGNAIYFGLTALFPSALRHTPFKLDLGLLFDFCLCLLVFLLLNRRS